MAVCGERRLYAKRGGGYLKGAAILFYIFEVILSHMPGERSGKESRWLAEWMRINEKVLRRGAHIILFFILSLLAGRGFGWYGIAGAVVWSIVDEITKKIVPGRHCSVGDIGLNLVGVAMGIVLLLLA